MCDNEWHHYAVNVRFPNVELFVDGEPYRSADGKGPEVIDDWPLHPAHGVNTTLVIGACWQGNIDRTFFYLWYVIFSCILLMYLIIGIKRSEMLNK